MTEIDTAVVRAYYEIAPGGAAHDNPAGIIDIALLCDALDEAREDAQESVDMMRRMRVQRDEARENTCPGGTYHDAVVTGFGDALLRAEKAEATIAGVRALLDYPNSYHLTPMAGYVSKLAVRAALDGETP